MNLISSRNLKLFLTYMFPTCAGLIFFRHLGRHSLWYDELETWHTVSQVKFSDFAWEVWNKQAGPPLYYFILWIFRPFFDFDEITIRFLSAFSMTGATFLGFRLVKKYLGIICAVGFVFLIGFNHHAIYFAQEARPYAFFLFLSLLGFDYALKIIEGDIARKDIEIFFCINFAILATHSFGAIFVLAAMATLLIFRWRLLKKEKYFLIGTAVLLATILLIFVLREFGENLFFLQAFRNLHIDYFYNFFSDSGVIRIFVLLAILGPFIQFLKNRSSKDFRFLLANLYLLVLAYLGIFLVSGFKPTFTQRDLFFLLPFEIIAFLGVVGFAFQNGLLFLKESRIKKIFFAGFMIIVFGIFSWTEWRQIFEVFRYEGLGKGFPYREAFQAIAQDEKFEPRTLIMSEDFSDKPYRYYGSELDNPIFVDLNSMAAPVDKKIDLLNLVLFADLSETKYFIKVDYKKDDDLFMYLPLLDYKIKIIFDSESISVLRISKKNGAIKGHN